MAKHQRNKGNGRERHGGVSREAVRNRNEEYRVARGAGFAHTLHRRSETVIDAILMEGLEIEMGQKAPYLTEQPRHITAIPFVSLDAQALRFLDVGREIETFRQDIGDYCKEVDKRRNRHFMGEIVEIIPIGGRKIIAEIEAPAVGASRQGLKQILSMAGVATPLMYAPHIVLGQADNFTDFRAMGNVAKESLRGTMISFDPVDVYTDSYTETVRPERIVSIDALLSD